MNSKTIVFVVFAVWSVICWRWYVCGIMEACGNHPAQYPGEEVVAVTETQTDPVNTVETPEIQPLDDSKPENPPSKEPIPTPAPPSQPVSASNINAVQMETVEGKMVIHFPYKSSSKEDNAAIDAYLENLAQQLVASSKKVTITGHTDFVGEPAENYTFGLQRATGIRDILLKKGVSKAQIVCKSSGDRKPVATNDTPYGRYLNRRVEIRVE